MLFNYYHTLSPQNLSLAIFLQGLYTLLTSLFWVIVLSHVCAPLFFCRQVRCWPFPNILSGMIISPLSLLQMTWPTAMIPLTVYLPKPFKSVFPFKNWTLDHWPVYAALYWTDLFGGPICTWNMTNGKSDTPILFPSYLLSLNFISLI